MLALHVLEGLRVVMERVFAVDPHAMPRQISVTVEPANVEVQETHALRVPESQIAWTPLE